jgi:hypothetical protein
LVFNTSNPDAVRFFLGSIRRYLVAHPEIDIFDCWPPDVARWAECPEMAALGTAVDRQAKLMNQVDSLLKTVRPGLKLEIIAYGQVLGPPPGVALNPDILVDFCPIDQSFERPLYDTSMVANIGYCRAVGQWRQCYTGDMALYSYYRKYAWHSLPVVLPHFMQQELRWYGSRSFRGVSTYSEPGDWYTYEVNHYVLAGLAWDPCANADSLTDAVLRVRYGSAVGVARDVYRVLGDVVREYCSIPYTRLKPVDSVLTVLRGCKLAATGLTRLGVMLDYVIADLEIVRLRSMDGDIAPRVKELVGLLEAHRQEGVFVSSKDDLGIFLKHYKSLK